MLFPTTLVGSYPQPDWLIDREKLAGRFPPRVRAKELWRVAPEHLAQAQDDATVLAIRAQERAGLDLVTDGEMRRESYSNHFATALDGVDVDHPGTALDRSGHPNPVPRIVGDIHRPGPVQVRDLEFLRAHTDRPVKKSDGGWTYFAPDIAYHFDKIERGYDELIDVLGADHGGYVKRMKAAVAALSDGRVPLDVKLCQLVRLTKGGEPFKMSKRAGTFVTLRIAAAHRDPAVYEAPHVVDVTRSQPVPLLSFGAGRHYCLGAALGRMELQEMVGGLVRRWPGASVGEGAELHIAASGHVVRLPLRRSATKVPAGVSA